MTSQLGLLGWSGPLLARLTFSSSVGITSKIAGFRNIHRSRKKSHIPPHSDLGQRVLENPSASRPSAQICHRTPPTFLFSHFQAAFLQPRRTFCNVARCRRVSHAVQAELSTLAVTGSRDSTRLELFDSRNTTYWKHSSRRALSRRLSVYVRRDTHCRRRI